MKKNILLVSLLLVIAAILYCNADVITVNSSKQVTNEDNSKNIIAMTTNNQNLQNIKFNNV